MADQEEKRLHTLREQYRRRKNNLLKRAYETSTICDVGIMPRPCDGPGCAEAGAGPEKTPRPIAGPGKAEACAGPPKTPVPGMALPNMPSPTAGPGRTGAGVVPPKTPRLAAGSGRTGAGIAPPNTPRPAGPEENKEKVRAPVNAPRLPEEFEPKEVGWELGRGSRFSPDLGGMGTCATPEKMGPGPRELELAEPEPTSWLGEP